MNLKKTNNIKQAHLMAVAFIAVSVVIVVASVMITGSNISQNLQNAMAQEFYQSGTSTTKGETSEYMTTSSNHTLDEAAVKVVNADQTTNKEFWINTVHFDGMTNINAAVKCDTCPQNTPLHPAEQPPINSTIPNGGGFRITEPNKAGAWDFRSFTFVPAQIVVTQGDNVTLHFIGVQGPHHIVNVDGAGTFDLKRGQINTISFIANNPGIINYVCYVHPPNMVGQILVLPKADV